MIKKVAIIGMGKMGKSITLALSQNDLKIVIVTRRGEEGFIDLRNYIEKHAQYLQISAKELISKISWVDDFRKVPRDVHLITETISENLPEKQELFKLMDKNYGDNVILSSATSSLSIGEISKFMSHPERMIGLHFLNPAYAIELVEVIPTEKTSLETIKRIEIFLQNIAKISLVVPDEPGFLVNRMLFTMINESLKILENGRNSAQQIDTAMKLGLKHPMGPLHLADLIGLDICESILGNLYLKTGNAQYEPNSLLVQKVKENKLGRKTGEGFFKYEASYR